MDQQSAADGAFRETMRTLIGERWRVVWAAIPAALEGSNIEGVHDVRVASRRLRAAMDIAEPAFPGKWYKPLHKTAKEITGALGEVRDRDVLLEALHADRSVAPMAEHPGIDRLIDRVERERTAARARMERFLRQLLAGPLPCELERRFGVTDAAANTAGSTDGRAS
jgi:CHAD domain-containing protein